MMNLLDQLQSSKNCQVCGKSKPISVFIIGTDSKGQPIYSHICSQCRAQQNEDDDSGGGKGLNIDHKARGALLDHQKKSLEEFQAEKKDYFEKVDRENIKDKDAKA